MFIFLEKKRKKRELKKLTKDIDRKKIGTLVVGLDEYSNPAWRLYKCVSDAINFRKMLKSVYSFVPENIRGRYNKEATKKTIMAELKALQEKFEYLVFFFSGHGYQVPTDTGEFVQGVVTYDHNWSRAGMLLDLDLKEIFNKFKHSWVFVDACHSGGISKKIGGRPKSVAVPGNIVLPNCSIPKPKAVFEFAACLPNEVAYEEDNGGVFTMTLLDILYHDSDIKLSALQEKLREKIDKQHPVVDAIDYSLPLFESYEEN